MATASAWNKDKLNERSSAVEMDELCSRDTVCDASCA